MQIKDIAKMAGVSSSTVSKIINGKDQGLNPKTRQKVLDIVKEYNYTPYASVKKNWSARSFLLGFLSNGESGMDKLQEGIVSCAQNHNYNILYCNSHGDFNQELKNITMLCRNRVDGVIWNQVGADSDQFASNFAEINIPVIITGANAPSGIGRIDYARLGYHAANALVGRGHQKIGCLIDSRLPAADFFANGYRQCLFDQNILFDEDLFILDEKTENEQIFVRGLTGVICMEEREAIRLSHALKAQNYKIPESLSIVTLSHDAENSPTELSLLSVPTYALGQNICKTIIAQIEKTEMEKSRMIWETEINNDVSVDIPIDSRRKDILVVGSIHMDVLMSINELPQVGKTVSAQSINTIPGGKGYNQAMGVAKLGNGVSLISKVGEDYAGRDICAMLNSSHVNIRGVSTDPRSSTGQAYIYVQTDGDSSIAIYAGANDDLGPEDITKNERLFHRVSFCLLPMEIPLKTTEFAAAMAKRHGIQTILKPAAVREISGELYRNIDFFIPNEKEAKLLCPYSATVEEQALYFLEQGVKTVIITLGGRGCFLKSKKYHRYFKAASFLALDSTGAADAFISALSVYLNKEYDLIDAIEYATVAAGFSISRQGTVPAMVDHITLELYMTQIVEQRKRDNA